jgi:hypothetical protein
MVCTTADILLSRAVYLAAGGLNNSVFHFQTQAQMGAMRPEAAEKPDAGRVAPICGSVSCQIYRLKSKFETM